MVNCTIEAKVNNVNSTDHLHQFCQCTHETGLNIHGNSFIWTVLVNKWQNVLIVVDAHSKWMEVEIVNSATSQATIECLRIIFTRFGLPEVMFTDNGTCFTSSGFLEFAQRNNIRHVCIAPYHPSSNGLAERAAQTFKLGNRKQLTGTLQTKLSHLLFQYRLTPNATTSVAPVELLLTRDSDQI